MMSQHYYITLLIAGVICVCLASHTKRDPAKTKSERLIFNKIPSELTDISASAYSSSRREESAGSELGFDGQLLELSIPCTKSCKYGLESNVEGKQICSCLDPCKGVRCFGGLTCTPERQCTFDRCTYTAVCKADAICSLPKPKHTFMCEKLSRRFYYDEKRGRCRKFWGCDDLTGNSFRNKKECKRSCYSKKNSSNSKQSRQQDLSSSAVPGSDRSNQVEISNHIPDFTSDMHLHSSHLSQAEEQTNHIESSNLLYRDTLDRANSVESKNIGSSNRDQTIGLNPTSGCPEGGSYMPCPFDPCAGCTNDTILCFTSFCGQCKAIYIDLRTGQASDEFAAIC